MYKYHSVVYILDVNLISDERIKTLRREGNNVVTPSAKIDKSGYPASFSASALNQLKVPTFIYTSDNSYEYSFIEDPSKSDYVVKTSLVSSIAKNLYEREIPCTIVYRKSPEDKNTRTFDIKLGADLYQQLNDFYGWMPKKQYKRKGATEITKRSFAWAIRDSVENVFGSVENFEKQKRIFNVYAEVYGFDKTNPIDLYEFFYMQHHREIAEIYVEDKFICPHCRSVVKINNGKGVYNINNGLCYNAGITICPHCYTKFDVHDKEDILALRK